MNTGGRERRDGCTHGRTAGRGWHRGWRWAVLGLALGASVAGVQAAAERFKDAVKARIENGYAFVLFADGRRAVVPLSALSDEEKRSLAELGTQAPLAHGKSEVRVVKPTIPVKPTIVTATVAGPLETVQLCPPNVPRNQLGGTCMLYARIHWLDIAGFYVSTDRIYKLVDVSDPEHPWLDPKYLPGLERLPREFTPRPAIHRLPAQELDPFEWARGELRKGRPILAAFPREVWQALPPNVVAAHPWNGGSVGHQVVVNGFTWNRETKQGTFHIVNSWSELLEFDLKTEAAKDGVLVLEASLSPKGEETPAAEKELVKSITFLRAAGKTNLYSVETNLGTRKVAAESEAAARALVEDAGAGQ